MEFWKNGISETSSEENDRPAEKGTAARRSYECTYCKRGFTNAQALGGHMNIHRKDRARAKQVFASSPSIKPHDVDDDDDQDQDEYTMAYKDFTPFSTQQAQRINHAPKYFQPSDSSPRYPRADHQQPLGANLSLQIGPTYPRDYGIETQYRKDDELDLELRLGHYP